MIFHCPCCHSRFSIDAVCQDEAARELLTLRPSAAEVAYLSLFRSESRALAWDRAVKLVKEVRALGEGEALHQAMMETVEALRSKGGKPLKNHNYLKAVLRTSTSLSTGSACCVQRENPLSGDLDNYQAKGSKRTQAMHALLEWGAQSWLHQKISLGLSALVARSLKGQPGADTIVMCADTWHLTLQKYLTIEGIDAERCMKGFDRLLTDVVEWPQPKQLIDLLPGRPERVKIRLERSDEEMETGRVKLAAIKDSLKV